MYIHVGAEMEFSFHDGTIRDLVFMQDSINRSSLLISGGAGDNKIYVTDCETGMPVRAMAGHSGKLTCICNAYYLTCRSGRTLQRFIVLLLYVMVIKNFLFPTPNIDSPIPYKMNGSCILSNKLRSVIIFHEVLVCYYVQLLCIMKCCCFSGHVYSLHTWGGCMFVSGSQDKTARFWDMRASTAMTVVPSTTGRIPSSINNPFNPTRPLLVQSKTMDGRVH